jgi:hypothetical protein
MQRTYDIERGLETWFHDLAPVCRRRTAGVPLGMSMQPQTSAALPHTSLRIKAMRTADTLEPIVGTRGAVITTFDLLGKLKWQVLPLCIITAALAMGASALCEYVASWWLDLGVGIGVCLEVAGPLLVDVFAVVAVFVLADDVAAGDAPRSVADAFRASLEFMARVALVAACSAVLWIPFMVMLETRSGVAAALSVVAFLLWIWLAPLAAMTVAVVIAEDISATDAARRAVALTHGMRLRFWVLGCALSAVCGLFAAISMIPLTFAPEPLVALLDDDGPSVIASLSLATSALGWYVLYLQARQQQRRSTSAT